MTKQAAVETAKFHARRRGEVYIVWSAPHLGERIERFHWIAPQSHPVPSETPGAMLEYVTI
jgi:hypothetical protein